MNVGFDIHGCIDLYSEFFSKLSKNLVKQGHNVHIVTGQEWDRVKGKVHKANVLYSHHFSVVDYHKSIGTEMVNKKEHWQTEDQWFMDEKIWVRTKGDYIARENIHLHFDDSVEYAEYMPKFCTFILVPKKGFVEDFTNVAKLMEAK